MGLGYVIHGASGSTEYDLCEHTKLEWKDATPEYFAAESAKHKKQPCAKRQCAIVVDDTDYAGLSSKVEKSNASLVVILFKGGVQLRTIIFQRNPALSATLVWGRSEQVSGYVLFRH